MVLAILTDPSFLIDCSYENTDNQDRQGIVLSSLGSIQPTHGSTFTMLSTGIAGCQIATIGEENPGDERGTWFKGEYGYPRDEVTLSMELQVPNFYHYIFYDIQFFSAEYPEYVGTKFNDKLTVTVDSPSQGISNYIFDVNSGYFVKDSNDIAGSGFDIFSQEGNPSDVDMVDKNIRNPGADGGASDLIQIGGFYHPISPNEIITITFNLIDSGDNLFDSAVFIDNLLFAGYATNNIIARNSVEDLNGGDVEIGDILEYSILLTNTGIALQNDYNGSEFENHISINTTFINGSERASSGNIIYDQVDKNISWNGEIPGETTVVLKYNVSINQNVSNDALIINQGIAYWDSDGFVGNDAREYTDDPNIDDGIDLDDDGMTLDDDPTILRVICYEDPSFLLEDFSDDIPGVNVSDIYFGRKWFDTNNALFGNIFEASENYKYLTPNSFKTKIRLNDKSQYWNYSLSELNDSIKSWEIWFRCSNTSEDSNFFLTFKNIYGEKIIKLKFEYIQTFVDNPNDWALKLSFQRPNGLWSILYSDYYNGYLYDAWYKLKVQDYGENRIIYSLNRTSVGEICNKIEDNLGEPLKELTNIEWTSTKDSVVCPIFFWDEHKLELINN
ncbi:choice-of-anchor L domain-containing protein [Thermoplasmatota archaeon]